MKRGRRNHSAQFKAKVAMEAVREVMSLTEIASKYDVHPNQIRKWKKQLIEESQGIFSDRRKREKKDNSELTENLYSEIGRLQMELNWLKKKLEL